jgi:hypothetical protein
MDFVGEARRIDCSDVCIRKYSCGRMEQTEGPVPKVAWFVQEFLPWHQCTNEMEVVHVPSTLVVLEHFHLKY